MREAQTGHRYRHQGTDVLALETGAAVRVAPILADPPWLGPAFSAAAEQLEPLPMAYFGGEVPA